MKSRLGDRVFILVAAFLCISGSSALPATVYVGWDSDTGFSPNSITINVGDTVAWINNDPFFSTKVTSDNSFGDPNYFQFYLVNESDVFGVTFDTVGTIGYHDDWGNSGSININNVTPIIISLTLPRQSSGVFIFDADGLTVGKTNVLEVSTNLTNWTMITTNVATSNMMTFTNSVIPGSQFFRVVQLP